MRFASPVWLFSLILLPGLMLFYIWERKRKDKALQKFGNLDLLAKLTSSASGLRRPYRRHIFFLLSLFFLILALARPQWGTRVQTIKRQGLDILLAIDTSKSMLAEDIKPNRLERAKLEIAHFIDLLQGDRVGLICFAGTSFVQCPLTLDYGAAKMLLKIIDTSLIPKGGTAIGEAIQRARQAFVQGERKYKVLILLTDGEDHESDPVEAAEEAGQDGIKIYTIGLGGEAGEPIPLKDEQGHHEGYVKDQQGNIVMSKLDQTTLEKIALATEGKYYHTSVGGMELERVLQDIAALEKKDLESKKHIHYEDRFTFFLWPALFFLILEFFLVEVVKSKKNWEGRFK